MNSCIIESKDGTLLKQIISHNPVMSIGLRSTTIGDKIIQEISDSIAKNELLQAIDVSSNSIGDAGGIQLCQCLVNCRMLKSIDLSSNSLTKEGVRAARDSLNIIASCKTILCDYSSMKKSKAK